jgi:hypothetical protein
MPVPTSRDWFRFCPADGDALGNDTVGCCVPAATFQGIRLRRAVAWNDGWKPTRDMVLDRYARLTGFDPVTGQPDNGTDTAAETLDYCTRGIQIGENDNFLDIPHVCMLAPANRAHMKLAVFMFGAVDMTLNLPLAVQDGDFSRAPGTGSDWVAGSWGAHRVLSGAFDGDVFVIRTWGQDKPVHPEFLDRFLLGCEARISRVWLTATGETPPGMDWDGLMADSERLAA